MIRDRDILLIGLLLGGVAGGLFYLAVWLPLPTEVRQALMLVIGMLMMAALSALSAYTSPASFLRAAAIATNSTISLDSNQSSPKRQSRTRISQNRSDLNYLMNEMHNQMRMLARNARAKIHAEQLSFVAIATSLRYHNVIDDKLFQGLVFFINTHSGFDSSLNEDEGLLDVTVDIGKGLLQQLLDLNTANESTQAQSSRSS